MQVAPEFVYLQCATACAAGAAVTDLRSRRIPNWLTGSGFFAGLLLHFVYGGLPATGRALLAALIAGGIFFVFCLAGGMGAGDVKLIAAVGSLAGLSSIAGVLIATALLGAIVAIITAVVNGRLRETFANAGSLLAHHQANGMAPHPELNVRNASMLRLPYAIPIVGGCLAMLLTSLYGGPKL
ncbi:MAG: A24 family peptidase [Janthinobacterium lividum]